MSASTCSMLDVVAPLQFAGQSHVHAPTIAVWRCLADGQLWIKSPPVEAKKLPQG